MDKVGSVTQNALQGIAEARRRLERAATDVATASANRSEPVALVDPLVRSLEAQRAFESSARVLERSDRALQSLLDALL